MTAARKIRVLVAAGSELVRRQLSQLLASDPQLLVVGVVRDGAEALAFLGRQAADVALLDLYMPHLDGFEATRRIMESCPLPIVVCCAGGNGDALLAFRALEAGALACVERPAGAGEAARDIGERLLQTLRLMSEVRVVRRRTATAAAPRPLPDHARQRVVGIGASTGGPPVLQAILHALPAGFGAPLLVVQHMAPGFLRGMATWLAETTGRPVHVAAHGVQPLPGHAYLAPDDFHMGLGGGGRIVLSREAPEHHVRPAVAFLFRSLARHAGPRAVGVLLTGMGRDGADELLRMREAGAATLAQDPDTAAVNGMPAAAVALGAAGQVLTADRIAPALAELLAQPRREAPDRPAGPAPAPPDGDSDVAT